MVAGKDQSPSRQRPERLQVAVDEVEVVDELKCNESTLVTIENAGQI